MNTLPELLSPAGDMDALRAAVDSGADAVYLGAKAFGARASAMNFDDEALLRAVEYAHLYHARVYVTVNTLVKETEFAGVRDTLRDVSAAGADAVIVQDLGVAKLVREDFPELELHASTQMALSNAADAAFAGKMGFSRVVLARECTLEEIRNVVRTGIETEVFAHGALCTAVSGRCLMSSMAGGRSGNRGRCAQPCRLELEWNGKKAAWLSLRDLCTVEHLPEFCAAGVTSLKLEGRLKSPEYVAVVTEVYRKALDDIKAGKFDPADGRPMEKLRQIFNRGGFTRGHAFHAEDAELCSTKRVAHEGLPVGKVLRVRGHLADVRLSRRLNNEDSLQIRGAQDYDLRYSGPEVAAGEIATLRLRPDIHAEAGAEVAKLSDAVQLNQARDHSPKKIPITMKAVFALDRPMRLTLSDGFSTVTAEGDRVQNAANRAATADDVCRQLQKLGDTPFCMAEGVQPEIQLEDGLFLPVSALNALRRQAAEELLQARIRDFGRNAEKQAVTETTEPVRLHVRREKADFDPGSLTVIFSRPEMAQALLDAGADRLWYQPESYRPEELAEGLDKLPRGVWLRLPAQCSGETLESIGKIVSQRQERIGGLVAESLGQLDFMPALPMAAGTQLPITNRAAVENLQNCGLSAITLWTEWNRTEVEKMLPTGLPVLMKMYGREQLMLLNHCPKRVEKGLAANRSKCAICKTPSMTCGEENPVLTDQRGYAFPMKRTAYPEGCIISVYNALPTDLRESETDRIRMNAGMLLHFTTEAPETALNLTRTFSRLRRGEAVSGPENATSGHWKRGVE